MVAIILLLALAGCLSTAPTDKTHAFVLSGQLKYLYGEWLKAGKPNAFKTSDYITSNTAQFFEYTNTITFGTNTYHCRFAVRSPSRFSKPGIIAITDERTFFWIGNDHTIVIDPASNGIKAKTRD